MRHHGKRKALGWESGAVLCWEILDKSTSHTESEALN